MPRHTIEYHAFADPSQLEADDRALLEAAAEARAHSYSPYSNFKVGAAARLADGTVVSGWNTENAAYPMCLCAEPATLAAAAAARPGMPVVALAVTVQSPSQTLASPASPCGSCRQQLAEHELRFGVPMKLILRGETGPVFLLDSASDLLPFSFSGELL